MNQPLSRHAPIDFSHRAAQAAEAVRAHWRRAARVGLVLGTGLGDLASHIDADVILPYEDIPHFHASTAFSHRGCLVCGELAGKPIVALDGRCHLYEGWPLEEIVFPVGALRALGVETLILSNASGGLDPTIRSGDIVVMEDHIDLMFPAGGRPAWFADAARRPGRSPYDAGLRALALDLALRQGVRARPGVYVAMLGPNYETRAEYRWLRKIGGDVVGMSTVPEALAAAALGMKVLALSVATNLATPDAPHKVLALDVAAAAQESEPALRRLVLGVIAEHG